VVKLFDFLKRSLRARAALGIALPILLVMTTLSLRHYWRERHLLEDQLRLSSLQLSEMLTGSLHHAMLTDDREMIAQIVATVGAMENIQQVQLINLDGLVKVDSLGQAVGNIRHFDDPGCKECHQYPPETRPRITKLILSPNSLRISTPIASEPECAACHLEADAHLGVLLTDVSLIDTEARLLDDLRTELLISLATMVLAILGIFVLIHYLLVRLMASLRDPLAQLADGDLSIRLPVSAGSPDELDRLANTINRMAEQLERHGREERRLNELQQQAIAEERGRIARDLHDGLAQLLGFVNTKTMAVRLMLKNRQIEAAERTLLQLEKAARGLFIEVREAILELKTPEKEDAGLTTALKDCIAQFSRLDGMPVEFTVDPAVEKLSLAAGTKQQLLRIVQESLTNVRKHASAATVCVSLQMDGNILELGVRDDGKGFDPEYVQPNHRLHFGLGTMAERAAEIGAEFNLASKPGDGTRVIVRLPLEPPPLP